MADSCTVASFGWAKNDEGHDPCMVASELMLLCSPSATLGPHDSSILYTPPTAEDQNMCVCSSVILDKKLSAYEHLFFDISSFYRQYWHPFLDKF
ncbi:hypothetical protein HYPSUDRAFT_35748 [Hypholoma sublateritium FD-334 SS-4]|uniref:Uncharacterized protein n=1 Tax=Hypholoma sublateritium (strain FD-334 SS-4) TaxID=945553 RepID=A0A0D2P868_HYPSF|nr:hypothetical protein HYPSUDRAFT_35748 [Hypholoma sublateritium FD-334 SS-4]